MNEKLSMKEVISLAIFTVIFYILIRLVSIVALIPGVYPFTTAITLIPLGTVWMYLRMKIKRKFSIFIQCSLLALLTLLGGSPYFIALGMFVGGLFAEFLTFRPGNYHRNIFLGYLAFGLVYHLSTYLIMLISKDYYVSYIESLGMPTDFVLELMQLVTWPSFLLGALACVIFSFLGIHIGKKLVVRFFNN